MIKPKVRWSFTDQPDIFRICRELAAAGCPLGTATRADGTITLVDSASVDPGTWVRFVNLSPELRFHVYGFWWCAKGDRVAALLKVSPVTVRGYKPSATGGL
jgi:hypothetical protein